MQNMEMFEKFNETFDVAGLKEDIEKAGDNEFAEVPHGDYEVSVEKLEIGVTGEKSKTPGAPMAKVWFKIVAGEYRGQRIFMNQMLTTGFGIHKMNEFLISLESGMTVEFNDFVQYAGLFEAVLNEVKDAEYQLAYGQNDKGYSTYNIVQRFPKE